MALVAVMLYDFQDRKFLPRERQGEEESIQEVRDVENYLLRQGKKNNREHKIRKNEFKLEIIQSWLKL